MNRLLLAALAASLGLAACSKEPAAPAATPAAVPAGHPAMPAGGGGGPPQLGGKVLQVANGGGYTYAEVDVGGGQKVWVAGGTIQVKPGDSIQWRDHAMMRNFNAKSLGRTFDEILFVSAWGPVGGSLAQVPSHGTAPQATAPQAGDSAVWQAVPAPGAARPAPAAMPGAQAAAAPAGNAGKVRSVANAGGYSYIEVEQGGGSLWVAVTETPVKAGDQIRWDGGALMQNFNAKSLGRTFDRIVFAGGVTVVK